MRLLTGLLVASLACATALGQTDPPASESPVFGRVCLAPLGEPAKGQQAPWRAIGDGDLTNYSVQIDQGQPVSLSLVEAIWVSQLSLTGKHLVVIRADDRALESFEFRFDQATFKNPAKPDLCLFINPLYFTWQLWPVERTGDWCPCWKNEGAR